MKRTLVLLLTLLFLGAGGIYWWSSSAKPSSKDTQVRDFLITKGSSAFQIGNKLAQEGFIKNSLAFKFYVQLTGSAGKIQAGEYSLSPNLSLFQIVDELLGGPKEIWVTIPEGLRREEVAQKFASSLEKDEEFIAEFLDASKNKEGFLFPDTYIFPKTASASAIVNKLLTTFDKKVKSEVDEKIITMASMVERETKTDAERAIVAGILSKRLAAGWPLQTDATLQYAVAKAKCLPAVTTIPCNWWGQITLADKEINSPYNTYKKRGLPPTPIANPGLSSIKAAIYPEDSEYWFYLHDAKGKIYYAKTIEEHNESVRKYLAR